MKIAVRRRVAAGAVVTTSALIAGLLIAPGASARDGGLSISPSGAENTSTAAVLTFNATEADLRLGGSAVFTRNSARPTGFLMDIDDFTETAPTPLPDRSQPGTTNLADSDGINDGTTGDRGSTDATIVGRDGPVDAGTYAVSATGNSRGTAPGPVVGGGNDTCGGCFTVLSPGKATVNSVSPTSMRPGTTVNSISLLGNNFERNSTIEVLTSTGLPDPAIVTNRPPMDPQIDGSSRVPRNGISTRTELRRQWVVANNAIPGARDVRVTNLDGNVGVCPACFFIAGPSLSSVTPSSAGTNDSGQAVTRLTFNGPSVTNGDMFLEFLGNPGSSPRGALTLTETDPAASNSDGTKITGTFNLSDAAPGVYQPVVRNSSGIVNACDSCRFTIVQRGSRTPTVTALDRVGGGEGIQKTQQQSSTEVFEVTGTNFSRGAQVVISGAGVTTTAVEFVNAGLLKATLQSTGTAAPGDRNVTVVLTDGKTSPNCANCYTVTGTPASPAPSSPPPPATATATVGARYQGLDTAVRVLDTRSNDGPRRSGLITLDLSSRITDANATAAVLNVTVTNPTARGFLVAYPSGNAKPGTSNVNFEQNQTQANEVVVRLPANRRVALFVDTASAHVIADLVGFTTTTANAGGRIVNQTPTRVFDSRTTSQPRRTGEVVVDLPTVATGTVGVILNVTATGSRTSDPSRGRGFIVAYATGTTKPATSNVNFDAGQQQANEVITRVGTGADARKVSLFIANTTVGLIVDLVGVITTQPVSGTQILSALDSPQRALDSRNGTGTSKGQKSGDVVLTLPSSVPSNATGVVLNVTATNGTDRGFVTVFSTGTANPGTSNVNFPKPTARTSTTPAKAGTQANEVISAINSQRQVTLNVGGAGSPSVTLIVDVVGFLTPPAG